jgi:hypothetical protein
MAGECVGCNNVKTVLGFGAMPMPCPLCMPTDIHLAQHPRDKTSKAYDKPINPLIKKRGRPSQVRHG